MALRTVFSVVAFVNSGFLPQASVCGTFFTRSFFTRSFFTRSFLPEAFIYESFFIGSFCYEILLLRQAFFYPLFIYQKLFMRFIYQKLFMRFIYQKLFMRSLLLESFVKIVLFLGGICERSV